MKGSFAFIRDSSLLKMIIAVVAGVLFVVGFAGAATTISTNISTGGTLSVTGASTLTGLTTMIQASSTRLSVHDKLYVGGSATTTIGSAGKVGIASSSPTHQLGVGTLDATSTVSGGYFCAFFQDEAGRGLYITLATSGNTIFATSTTACDS